MVDEPEQRSFRELCDRLRALDPDLARELEDEREQVVVDAKRRLADLEELHNANRLVTVGTLTAGMAHELGTPLGVVLARAQMIADDEGDIADARNDAAEIIHQVQRMTQMCREVLDFARPKPPARDRVDVVEVIRHMIVLLLPEARKRTVKLVLADGLARGMVLGDPSKLMQVFTNVTINATQSMPKGGTVTITVSRRRIAPPVVERLPETDYICVGIQDTGTGIRSADLAHIFDTFFTTKGAEGSGIGLAVSSRIAREHDGWIGVATDEGRGSTFTVHLPPIAT